VLAKSSAGETVPWSPISCTLIRGKNSAVLVDTPITIDQTTALADWIRAIELVESLEPHIVIPGHKRPGAVDGVHYLKISKQYILDFQAFLDEGVSDPKVLFGKMMERDGGRLERAA
jgi:hypothetical protein